jgi:hypothetical protein
LRCTVWQLPAQVWPQREVFEVSHP